MNISHLPLLIYRWRVRAGFFGIVLSIFLAQPTVISLLIGSSVCAVGLGIRTWASGHLKKERELAVSGPYRYTRNPLYFANLLLGISVAIGARSCWVLGIFLLYFLLFYPVIIFREKTRMKQFFPQKYEEFGKKVPLFFPTCFPSLPRSSVRFSWTLHKKNKESRALFGALLFWSLLVLKYVIF